MCSLRAEYTVDEGMGIVVPSLEEAMAPHSSTLAWKIPGTGSLVGCSPWGHKESDRTAVTECTYMPR